MVLSNSAMKIPANAGANGAPIATPSFYTCGVPLKVN